MSQSSHLCIEQAFNSASSAATFSNTQVERSRWSIINRKLIAKIIGELSYEECFQPEIHDHSLEDVNHYTLSLSNGIEYTFTGWKTCWGLIRVDEQSLLRNGNPITEATQFFIDAQQDIGADDIILGNLIEECLQTLAGDLIQHQQLQSQTATSLASLSCDELQGYLDGHPKATLNKGRLGWGSDELQRYTPEARQPFQLRWIAISKRFCTIGASDPTTVTSMAQTAMSANDWQQCEAELSNRIESTRLTRDDYVVIPVHPWQWQQVVSIHYASLISSQDIVDLGFWGHQFIPLQSIRTLANINAPDSPNIKLPVTILNTSCYRGIPSKYINIGAPLSEWLQNICKTDRRLQQAGTRVLQEPLGISCTHPQFNQVPSAPYRYKETLGVIWRESIHKSLKTGEEAMLVAALLQCDKEGDSIIGELIKQSNVTAENWCREYFKAVVIPLYHLMCRYGVGLVAHGQNLTLVLENSLPNRLAIKDLQGDLRIVDQDFPELSTLPIEVYDTLDKLPAMHLLHDLLTGHFVTVLRHLSALLQEQNLLHESSFYSALRDEITQYQTQHTELADRFRLFPLCSEKVHKLCINRVRFEQGYQDTSQRPVPILGCDIPNPLTQFS
ncbi:IucA/IucC family protein [Aurantivibrio plasticivorans]